MPYELTPSFFHNDRENAAMLTYYIKAMFVPMDENDWLDIKNDESKF